MKKTIFTVIVAVLAAAFIMVGNSFAEDQEQEAQENIISTADCTAAGTGTIYGMVTDASTGAPLGGVYVNSSLGTGDTTDQGFYFMLSRAGSGTLTFTKAGYAGGIKTFTVCAGTSTEINASLIRMKTTTTTSVAGCN